MKEDIKFHTSNDIYIVAIKEWDKDFLSQNWNIYFINNTSETIETVLVMSRGVSSEQKTATLRHNLGNITSKKSQKVEFIMEEVLSFKNEYLVTFFLNGKLYEKQFIFSPNSISERNIQQIPFLKDREGIIAK